MMATGWEQAPHTTARWTRVTAQWLAVVGPPVAAFAQQQLAYYFVSSACARRLPILLHLPAIVMLAFIAAAIMYSWREWTRERDRPAGDNGQVGSARFFALLGLAMGGISIVVLLAQWLPTLIVSPCPP
jgi:hypothetical protein